MKKELEIYKDEMFNQYVVRVVIIDSNGYECESVQIWCDYIDIKKDFIYLKNQAKNEYNSDDIVSLFINDCIESIIEYDNIQNHNIIKRIK